MGTMNTTGMDFSPVNITPPGAINNPQTQEVFRPSIPYAEPAHLVFIDYPGPWARGMLDTDLGNIPYLAWGPSIMPNNDQIVTVPEPSVDRGTEWPSQQISGVALQGRNVMQSTTYFGQAPTSGVYTGGTSDGCNA